MICDVCATAADYGRKELHRHCDGCDCHHQPIEGKPRLVGTADVELSPAERVGLLRRCNYCDKLIKARKDGLLRRHKDRYFKPCAGSES